MVGFQGLGEQAAAVEGMLAQHALAPAVDGRYRSLVHPLHGDFQAPGTAWPGIFRVIVTQLMQQRVGRLQLATEEPRSFGQAGADTFAQLFGGGVGEGHHEDLRWQQLALEALFATVTEDQAQVQRRNGEGLARAGAGLDQLAAMQGETQCQGTVLGHAPFSGLPRVCHGALNNGRYKASHQPSKVSSAVSAAKSRNCRARAMLSLRSPKLVRSSPS
ncbi:hypothetical protein D3C76_862250 [compost metagenome]